MIPSFDLKKQFQSLKGDMMTKLEAVLDKGAFILGQEVQAFEREFAKWNGSPFAVGVANGTDALQLALRAVGVGPNDEVICPAFTYVATASAISFTGAKPVFVDISLDDFGATPENIERAITPKTRAVVLVHLYGHPAKVEAVAQLCRAKGLSLIEDCAQATGAKLAGTKVGNFGVAGCYSFYPTKNLGGYGDGGLVTCQDEEFAKKIRMLRAQGQGSVVYQHELLGTNSRLDELQAAILRVKLPHLDEWNRLRREIAEAYSHSCTEQMVAPKELPGCHHVFHQYTLRCSRRADLQKHLASHNIGHTIYYPISLHLQPAYRSLGYKAGDFPNAEQAQSEALSLPMFPELSPEQRAAVCQALKEFV